MAQMKTDNFDIIIAGGGMAGCTLAVALLQAVPSLKLAIIEKQAADTPSASFDSRSIALAAGSVSWLKQWGLWHKLAANACPITDIHVSDRGHFGKTYLSAAEYQQQALGYVLEVEHLGQVLQQQLATDQRVTFFQPHHIQAVNPQTEYQQIVLDDKVQLTTSLLVIAEGGASPSRTLAGFSLTESAYQQTAVIANLGLTSPHHFKAYERFTADGPIALLPLTAQRFSLVWTTSAEPASTLMQLQQDAFLEAVQQAFGYRAGIFEQVGQRASYPLVLRQAEQIVRHRTALLGNSLHNIHPIAGQGFNLAVRDIAELTACISESATDIGGYTMLRRYEQARRADMQRVILLTDTLVRSFSNRSRLVALARNTGLAAMLLSDGLKRPLALQTMGLRDFYAKR